MTEQSKRPLPGNPAMTISDPPDGANVGPSFSVCGTCDGISPGSNIVIAVTLAVTTTSTIYTFQRQAMINADYQTWEAYFDEVPQSNGASASITATCTGGGSASIGNLTVNSTGMTTVEIDAPLDNQEFVALAPPPQLAPGGGPPQPAPPVAMGKRGNGRAVAPFVTQAGYMVLPSNPPAAPADDPPGLPGDTQNWSYNLQDLMPNPAAPGTYVLHVQVVYGSKVYYQAAGTFVYNPPS
jgi:hypothetical protein